MALDDVAVDFPDLTIICAHPSVPWNDEALAVATHKPNVYIDLSGWSPKYFPPQLVRQANTILKVLFGSDYPVITPDRWMRDFDNLDIRDQVRPLIFKEMPYGHWGCAGTGVRSAIAPSRGLKSLTAAGCGYWVDLESPSMGNI